MCLRPPRVVSHQVESVETMPWLVVRVLVPSLRASHSQKSTPAIGYATELVTSVIDEADEPLDTNIFTIGTPIIKQVTWIYIFVRQHPRAEFIEMSLCIFKFRSCSEVG